ncbi:iron complex transport system permease protein [Actinobaculum suis]|uniref:Iron ABC transporter permease n=1 Tax=Actinobaculum suis TaxID=1657 RepID=A0A1G7AH20_9ACTO|nr:iron ABC transporter permease [Actinobaculum suis]MDY5152561.1 iron ABC transporter permease [Actinobaculum suis]SDE14062.1 iron complex transport system permease protein [Actinobaculum suis]
MSKRIARTKGASRFAWVVAAALLVLVCAAVDLLVGPADIKLSNLAVIFDPTSLEHIAFFRMRMPQTLMAIGVGLSLGLAGAVMQTILNNPLASPFTLGVSSAASFGAAVVFVLALPIAYVTGGALVMALLAVLVIFGVGNYLRMSNSALVLAGIALNFFFDALLSLIQYRASEDTLSYIVFWTMGSLSRGSYGQAWALLAVCGVAFLIILKNSWNLTALKFGEERAQALGVPVARVKILCLILVSIVTAVAVSFCGKIGFIGLAAPHLARRFVSEDQRFYVTASALMGAIILLVSSILSKLVVPGVVVPIGIISSLIGIPFLVYALLSQRRRRLS